MERRLIPLRLQKAIDAAVKSHGTVSVPAGTYLSGSIFVKSGVTLRIENGATILGSQHLADYPLMPTRIAGIGNDLACCVGECVQAGQCDDHRGGHH